MSRNSSIGKWIAIILGLVFLNVVTASQGRGPVSETLPDGLLDSSCHVEIELKDIDGKSIGFTGTKNLCNYLQLPDRSEVEVHPSNVYRIYGNDAEMLFELDSPNPRSWSTWDSLRLARDCHYLGRVPGARNSEEFHLNCTISVHPQVMEQPKKQVLRQKGDGSWYQTGVRGGPSTLWFSVTFKGTEFVGISYLTCEEYRNYLKQRSIPRDAIKSRYTNLWCRSDGANPSR